MSEARRALATVDRIAATPIGRESRSIFVNSTRTILATPAEVWVERSAAGTHLILAYDDASTVAFKVRESASSGPDL